jgi:Cdc6-like AAA superfamily ATPase
MDLIRRRHDGTGTWLINSHEFKDWQNGSCKTLFCPGIPGAGKTLLASIVINHLLNTFRNDNIGIAYIFGSYQSREKQTPIAIFSSLLEQMLIQRDSIPDNLQRLYDHHISRRTRPTFDDVFSLLRSEIRTFDQTFVVIDALDEYNNDNGVQEYMVHRLLELQDLSEMNLLVTSRFVHQIESYFQRAVQVEIRANEEDVRSYIRGNMHLLATKPCEGLEEAIVGGITQVVDGMYRRPAKATFENT